MTEDARQQRRNRGLRAAPPPPETARRSGAPSPEIAALLDDIEEENKAAGLTATPLPSSEGVGGSTRTVRSVEIEHDYEVGGPGTFTALTGLVLRVKPYSNEAVLQMLHNTLPDQPQPPKTWNEADQKNYVDTEDVDYKRALGAFLTERSIIEFRLRVTMGTEILTIPPEMDDLDGNDWVAFIGDESLFGKYAIKPQLDGKGRYCDWLRFYALTEGDVRHLYQILDHVSGVVREIAVVEAVKSFRGAD